MSKLPRFNADSEIYWLRVEKSNFYEDLEGVGECDDIWIY